MNRFLVRSAVLAGAGALVLAFSATAPAMAVSILPSLPEGQEMYVLSCNDSRYNVNQIFQVDAATGAYVTVGTPSDAYENDYPCYGQTATDPTDGTVYALTWSNGGTSLGIVDIATGSISEGVWITLDGETFSPDVLAIGLDGAAYLIDEDDEDSALYSFDLTTGAATLVSSTTLANTDAFAVQPQTGVFYVVGGADIYTIDVTDGETTFVGSLADDLSLSWYFSLSFDNEGHAWLLHEYYDQDDSQWYVGTVEFDPADVDASVTMSAGNLIGDIEGEPHDLWVSSLYISGTVYATIDDEEQPEEVVPAAEEAEATLAETGVADATPIVLFSALGLALLGGVLVASGRRRTSSEA